MYGEPLFECINTDRRIIIVKQLFHVFLSMKDRNPLFSANYFEIDNFHIILTNIQSSDDLIFNSVIFKQQAQSCIIYLRSFQTRKIMLLKLMHNRRPEKLNLFSSFMLLHAPMRFFLFI